MSETVSLPVLNLPEAPLRLRQGHTGIEVWDQVRRKYVLCTPEEWVRQHLINLLNTHLGYPLALMRVERGLKVGKQDKRTDLVVYKSGQPYLLLECKAPQVALSTTVLDQVANYNRTLGAPIILVSNGLEHWAASTQPDGSYIPLAQIPAYA